MTKETSYISELSVISTICVVYMHLCGFHGMIPQYNFEWILSLFIEKVCFFAVPVFFMITGATLIDYPKRYNLKTYVKKRINKTVIPWLAWGGVSFVYYLIFNFNLIENLKLNKVVNGILNNEYRSIYWFFPVMISVYICLPLFAYVDEAKKSKIFSYLIIVGMLFNIILPDINSVFNIGIDVPIKVPVVSEYLIYVLTGYLISHNNTKNKNVERIIYASGIIALAIQIIGTGVLSLQLGYESKLFRETTILSYCYATSVFVFFKNKSEIIMNNNKLKRLIEFMKNYTLPIYLIHQYANNLVQKILMMLGYSSEGRVMYQLLGPVVAVTLSIFCTWIIRQIPVIKKIVPQ